MDWIAEQKTELRRVQRVRIDAEKRVAEAPVSRTFAVKIERDGKVYRVDVEATDPREARQKAVAELSELLALATAPL